VGPYTEEFTDPLPADKPEADVVIDFRKAIVLWDKSQQNFGLVTPVRSYVTGTALADLNVTLSHEAQTEMVPAGVERIFQTLVLGVDVTGVTGPDVEVQSCVDDSKEFFENPRTHAVDKSGERAPLNQQYFFLDWLMTQVGGHWAIKNVKAMPPSSPDAKSCLP
jgi:hypothetical protein